MNFEFNWLFKSFIILLFGTLCLLAFPFYYFIPYDNVKILCALFTLPVFSLSVIFILCGKEHGKNMWRELGFKPLTKEDIRPLLLTFPIFLLFVSVTACVKKLGLPVQPQTVVSIAASCPDWLFIMVLISAGIFAPFCEELVYRRVYGGFFQRLFPQKEWVYFCVPSFMFALAHGIVWQSVLLFFFALYLQKNYVKGSTTRVILIHALFNWSSLIFLILARIGAIPQNV